MKQNKTRMIKEKPKILVVNSPLFKTKNEKYDEDSLPPIGLGIIATAIADRGFDVHLIDAVAENIPLTELMNQINTSSPDFICINVFSTNLILVKELIETYAVDTHFIIGGLSTRDLQEEIFSWETNIPIDVVHGDGEKIVPDIISGTVAAHPSLHLNRKRYFEVDKSSLYYVSDISEEKLDRNFFVNEPIVHPFGFKEACIVTSRGCIYNCAFCAAARSVNGSQGTREKSGESIVREIRDILEIYPDVDSIRVLDDLFLKSRSSITKAIEVFSQFNIQWRAMAHVETFRNADEALVQELRASGCKELFLGIESGSPRILRMIHKTHRIEKVKSSVEILLRNGIDVKGYFIYGFPSETEVDFKMTYDLALHLTKYSLKYGAIFRTSVFQYRPYHGTELYHKIKEGDKSAVTQIDYIEPNEDLSDDIGRLQFNFHSGNYSAEEAAMVSAYIIKTTKLNSLRIFGINGGPKERVESNRRV